MIKVNIDLELLKQLVDNDKTNNEIAIILEIPLSRVKRLISVNNFKRVIKEKIKKPCLQCEKIFAFKQHEDRKFCSSSCSAIFNNKHRIIINKSKLLNCKYCNNEIKNKNNKTYCNKTCYYADNIIHITHINKKCKHCNNILINNKTTFCNQTCCHDYKRNMQVIDNTASFKSLKIYLIKQHGAKCSICGWDKINEHTGNVPIEMDHIDGNNENNDLTNLRLLCPNCHSLTSTYKGANKGKGRIKRMKRYYNKQSY